MMKNFSIPDSITIQVAGGMYDIHNDFDLVEVSSTPESGDFQLKFLKSPEANVRTTAKGITLKFMNVSHLSLTTGAASALKHGVNEIGYKAPADLDHDWLGGEAKSSSSDHLVIRLQGDELFRVYSASAIADVIF